MQTTIRRFSTHTAKALAAGALALTLTATGLYAPLASAVDTEGKQTKLSTEEQTYLQQTASDNLGEMSIAYLALEKAAKQDTKDNAKDIIDTHTKSMKELMALASKHDYFIKLQPDMTSYEKLVNQGGITFDKFYAAEQQKLNEQSVSKLNGVMNSFTDDDVKDFAKDDLSNDKSHLEKSKDLAAKLKND